MKNFIETPIFSILCKLFDLVILNLLYLLCCIPILSIGAATTALYTAVFALIRDDAHIPSLFLRSFAKNWKASTVFYLLWLVAAAVVCADFGIIAFYWTMPGKYILLGILVLSFFLLMATGIYVFPLLAVTESKKAPIATAFFLSIRHLPRTILLCLLHSLPILLLLLWPYGFLLLSWIFLLIWFSLDCYVTLLLLKKVLPPIFSEEPSL